MPDVIITPSSGIVDFFPGSTRVGRIDGSGNNFTITNPSGYIFLSSSGLSINSSSPNAELHVYSAVSGDTLFNLEGTNGSLFSVVDSLSGSLMSVNNNAGLPVFEVFSDDSIIGGRFAQNDFVISSGGNVGIGTASPSGKLDVRGNVYVSGNLGIGTTSPTSTLHVVGSGLFSNNITASGFIRSGGTSSQFLKADGSVDSTTYQAALTNPVTGTGTTNTIPKWNSASGLTNSLLSESSTTVVLGGNLRTPGGIDDTYLSIDAGSDRVGITKKNGSTSKFTYGSTASFAIAQSNNATIAATNTFTDRFVIDSGGRVGIGTNSPQAGFILDIYGSTVHRGSFVLNNTISEFDNNRYRFSHSIAGGGADRSYVCNGGGTFGVGFTAPSGRVAISGSVAIGSNYNLTPPTNGLIVEGNVGIGTSSPDAKLVVNGDAYTVGKLGVGAACRSNLSADLGSAVGLQWNDGSFVGMQYINTNDYRLGLTLWAANRETRVQTKTGDNSGIITFYPSSGTAEVARFHSNNNFGIGTTNPSSKLQVSGLITSNSGLFTNNLNLGSAPFGGSPLLFIQAPDTLASTSSFRIDNTSYQPIIDVRNDGNIAMGNFSSMGFTHRLTIKGSTNDSTRAALSVINSGESTLLYVRNDGNVGIGTSTPTSTLHVVGSGNITSDLTVGGNLTVNGTVVTANVDRMEIEDPILTLGLASGNIVTNDTLDRGLALIRGTGLTAFMGWDSSASQFVMLSSGVASNSSGNYDAGTYGNLQINNLTANSGNFSLLSINNSGVVVGPSSSTSGNVVMFDGTTGKIIKNGGFLASDIARLSTNQTFTGTNAFRNGNIYLGDNTDTNLYIGNTNNNLGITSNPAADINVNSELTIGCNPWSVNYEIDKLFAGISGVGVSKDYDTGNNNVTNRLYLAVNPSTSNTPGNTTLITSAVAGNITITLPSSGGTLALTGHTHISSNITDFNSSVSGLLPTVANSGSNRIVTSTGSTVGLSAQPNMTFNGSLLNVTGSGNFTSNIVASGFVRSGGTSTQFLKADGSVDSTAYTTNAGTVTSVAALTLGTTGTDVSSSVSNGTTTPVITLNIPTASASNRGALSSGDWTTFNNKAAANQTMFIGTTSIAINRTSAAQTLTGVSIDGNAGTVTNGVYTTGSQTINGAKTFGDVAVFSSGLTAGNIQTSGNTIRATNSNGNLILSSNGTGSLQRDSGGNARGQYAVDWQNARIADTQIASGNYSVVGGGENNTANGNHSSVVGGKNNLAIGTGSFINGSNNVVASNARRANNITSSTNTVTVLGATASNFDNTTANAIQIRYFYNNTWNLITRTVSSATQAGNNVTLALTSNVGAASQTWTEVIVTNVAESNSVVGGVIGGSSSIVIADHGTIGGGLNNTVTAQGSTVAGGTSNSAVGNTNSTVGGGSNNTANGPGSTVAGGLSNTASGYGSAIGGGVSNTASSYHATVGGGNQNIASNTFATVGGGAQNEAGGIHCTVGGGESNTASAYYGGATVGGGFDNNATEKYSTIGGGRVNTASAYYSTVGGGSSNTSSGAYSTVGGGNLNTNSGNSSTIGGGNSNTSSGTASTVPGGYQAKTSRYGELSHAAGKFANDGDAQHTILIARRVTSDATANVVLTLDGATPASNNRLTLPAKTTWSFNIKLSAYNDTDSAGAAWEIRGGIRRNGANGTVLLGTNTTTTWAEGAMSTASVSAVADDTNEALEIRVTGIAAKNIRWVAVVDISQVSYGTP